MSGTEDAVRRLATYEKTRQPADLERAFDAIAAVDLLRAQATNRGAARVEVTRLWLAAFRLLDERLDPQFDPDDSPLVKVDPPKVDGVTYPPGVDPKVITDPRLRAEYEAAIKANHEKIESRRIQLQLRTIDRAATEAFERFLKRFYTFAAADAGEMTRLLEEKGIQEPRRSRIMTAVRARQ